MKKKDIIAEIMEQKPLGSNGFFSIRARKAVTKGSFTVLVPKKIVPNIVARNRLRRRTREAFFSEVGKELPAIDIVVLLRSPNIPRGGELHRILFELLRKSGIVFRQ